VTIAPPSPKSGIDGELDEETLMLNRQKLAMRMKGKDAKKEKSPKPAKDGKKPRVWDLGGNTKDLEILDRTKDKLPANGNESNFVADHKVTLFERRSQP